jgi:hypothetical protein
MAFTHGKFYWNELNTRDPEAAKKFYSTVCGWTYDGMPMPDGKTYWVAKLGGDPVAGFFDISAPEFEDVPEGWLAYIAVDNVDAQVAKATQAGAQLMKPAFDIPTVGRIALLLDPGQAGIALITPAS